MVDSKKSRKPIMIFIYGFPAVGKLTVAKKLSKMTGYKLLHNHMILDLLSELFPESSKEKAILKESLYVYLASELIKTKNNIIYTYAYSNNFKSRVGTKDPSFVLQIKNTVERNGGVFYPIYLHASKKEILARTIDTSRRKYRKVINTKIITELLKKFDHDKPVFSLNNIIIDTTKTTPQQSAKLIAELIR